MIIRAGDPGSENLRVIDTVTGEELNGVVQVNTETGEGLQYVRLPNGSFQIGTSGDLVIVPCPNPVRVEAKP